MNSKLIHSRVALSVSESPDQEMLGFGKQHTHDASIELATQLLSLSAELSYGGDLRPSGLTFELINVAYRYRENEALAHRRPALTNFLAWPVYVSFSDESLIERLSLDQRIVQTSFLGIDGSLQKQFSISARERFVPTPEQWRRGLSSMRRYSNSHMTARVVMGGAVDNYKGVMPGIAEEALLALEARKPLFLIGGLGGCARDICENMGLCKPAQNQRNWPSRGRFSGQNVRYLNNGLSDEEKVILANTVFVEEASVIIMRGLIRLAGNG